MDTVFTVVCYNHSKLTSIPHLLKFAVKLETHSQLNDIFEHMKK